MPSQSQQPPLDAASPAPEPPVNPHLGKVQETEM